MSGGDEIFNVTYLSEGSAQTRCTTKYLFWDIELIHRNHAMFKFCKSKPTKEKDANERFHKNEFSHGSYDLVACGPSRTFM